MIGLVVTVTARNIESKLLRKKAAAAAIDEGEGGGGDTTYGMVSGKKHKDSKAMPLVGAEEEEEGGL